MAAVTLAAPAGAQQKESHLDRIVKSQKLRVCIWPEYYAISYKNPKTGQLEGIDIDMAESLAKALGVKTETEAVALGLGAAVDLAEFQHEMLAGFDHLMKTRGLSPVEGEEVVLDGFRARPAR